MKKERRRHHAFRILFMDVTEFVRRFLLRREGAKLVPGPRPAAHSPQSGSQWDESLATGIDRIDFQHRQLMAEIQNFQQAAKEGAGLRVLEGTVQVMARYTEDHFTLEESYMAHVRYPHLPAHREDHSRLRKRIQYLQQRLSEGDSAKALELSVKLCQYLRDHILKEDANYAEFARNA